MQRREGRSSIKLPEDRIVNEAMLPELRSAMHDAIAGAGILESARTRPMRMIASRWLEIDIVSESTAFSREI